jgi:hypothetical protein
MSSVKIEFQSGANHGFLVLPDTAAQRESRMRDVVMINGIRASLATSGETLPPWERAKE